MADLLPPGYLDLLARIESNHRPFAKAATSTASGAYQFTRGTWLALGGSWGTNWTQAFGGMLPTLDEQTARARALSEANATALAREGIEVSKANLYGCHFLGPHDAIRVLNAAGWQLLDGLISPQAIKANLFLDAMTVTEFEQWLSGKVA